jgi:restriction endonuclease S subunit
MLPPLDEQRRIAVALSAIDRRLENEATSVDVLDAVKRYLADVLLSGQLRVSGLVG